MPPTIRSARLELVGIEQDVAAAVLVGGSPGFEAGEGWPHDDTPDGMAMIAGGAGSGWLVVLDGRVIGDCGVFGPPDESGAVEIGYGLAAPSRGLGYGTELVQALSDHLLGEPGVVAVEADVEVTNLASRTVLERAGFEAVGAPRNEPAPDGPPTLRYRRRSSADGR